jgi:hypothetical protein
VFPKNFQLLACHRDASANVCCDCISTPVCIILTTIFKLSSVIYNSVSVTTVFIIWNLRFFTAAKMSIVAPCGFFRWLSKVLQNVGNNVQVHAVSQSRIPQSRIPQSTQFYDFALPGSLILFYRKTNMSFIWCIQFYKMTNFPVLRV